MRPRADTPGQPANQSTARQQRPRAAGRRLISGRAPPAPETPRPSTPKPDNPRQGKQNRVLLRAPRLMGFSRTNERSIPSEVKGPTDVLEPPAPLVPPGWAPQTAALQIPEITVLPTCERRPPQPGHDTPATCPHTEEVVPRLLKTRCPFGLYPDNPRRGNQRNQVC